MIPTYTADELEALGTIPFPYIEQQAVGGMSLLVYIDNYRSEDWYGYKGWRRRVDSKEKAQTLLLNTHNSMHIMLRPGDVVFDCGANEGYITALLAKWVGPTGKVVAFEPDPKNVEVIKKTLELNKISNVTVICKAVSDKSGELVSFGSEVVGGVGFNVETATLDDFASAKPDFIKIDVEGYELPVLRGASEVLKQCRALEIELHLSQTTGIHMRKRFGFEPNDIYKILRANDFDIKYHGKDVKDGEEPQGCVYSIKTKETANGNV